MKTIVAVEENKHLRGLLAFMLTQAGYDVRVAPDAEAARAVLAMQRVDCVLAGMSLPEGQSLSLIKNVRESKATATTPIIMLAGEKDETLRQEGRQAGATGWVKKPFNTDKLLGALQRVLS